MARRQFETTQWSLVLAAQRGDERESQKALTALCEIYWPPIYTFLRYQGYDVDQAKDLTQDFFTHILGNRFFYTVDKARGRFRSYMLASIKNFLADRTAKNRTQKRGADLYRIPLDVSDLEAKVAAEFAGQPDAEIAFDKLWAYSILDNAEKILADEYGHKGKIALFTQLKSALHAPRRETNYAELAQLLNMTEGAVRVAVRRLRMRYGEIIRGQIRETVEDPGDTQDEIRYLLSLI